MKIGYFADGPWSHLAVFRLLNDNTLSISFICVRYDNPDLELIKIAKNNDIPLLMHKNINSDEFYSLIVDYQCDIFISMSFNQIFKQRIINCSKFKTINCHAGKLPFYRGRNILNWALINDEKEFGITVHFVDEGIDTGDIILQRTFSINDEDDYSTLLKRSYEGCSNILFDAVKQIQNNEFQLIKQEDLHPVGFYCIARKEGDEKLNWNMTSREVFNFVRAICKPGPQAVSFIANDEIKINKVQLVKDAPNYKGIPGAVLKSEKERIFVKTSDSFIIITEWSTKTKIKTGDRLI